MLKKRIEMGSIAMEEFELMKDSKYRVYVTAVDKALKNFEYSTEWADLISALGKLNKVLVIHSKFPVIPRRIKISKRLAQCLHPCLPFGVHLKALETYDIIFKSMGTGRLACELFIYSAGLFPLFGHAAMKVRPFLLDIYENHFVPLGSKLRPALPGFLNAILMGLEENADHYPRTNRLLEQVCEDVGALEFYGCLWDCLSSNSAIRHAAVTFILSHFDRKLPTEDQPHIMGTNIETMVVGLMGCVQDGNVLVQRSALDLLQVGFPMHNSHLTSEDMVRLVTASLATVLRRDMSLNRRLYAWLLGSEINIMVLSHHPLMRRAIAENRSTSYFDVFSRGMLIEAINTVLDNAIGKTPHDLGPYKLLRTLLDKPEIGAVISDDLLFQVFRLVYLSYQQKCDNTPDMIKCVCVLLSSISERRIWDYLGKLVQSTVKDFSGENSVYSINSPSSWPYPVCDDENPVRRVSSDMSASLIEVCAVSELLLDVIPTDSWSGGDSGNSSNGIWSSASGGLHLLQFFLQVVSQLSEKVGELPVREIVRALRLCSKLLARAHPPPNEAEGYASNKSAEFNSSLQMSCVEQYKKLFVMIIKWARQQCYHTVNFSNLAQELSKQQRGTLCQHSIPSPVRMPSPASAPREPAPISEPLNRYVRAVELASRLLVDLSTLHTEYAGSPVHATQQSNEKEITSFDNLPEWLLALVVSASCEESAEQLRIIAIKTLLDLVVLYRAAESMAKTPNADTGATPILIVPLMSSKYLTFLQDHTIVFQLVTDWLWESMDCSEYLVQSVEQLQKMHSALPNIVDRRIELYLTWPRDPAFQAPPDTIQLKAFSKFATLWHVGREWHAKLGNMIRVSDIFCKCMVIMLEQLNASENDILRLETQNWLLHSLLRGDIYRILDPLLVMLLDQSTARLSVHHVRVNDSSLGDGGSFVLQRRQSVRKGTRRVQAITSLQPDNTTVTEKSSDPPQDSMSLYVNPLSSKGTPAAVLCTDFDDYYDSNGGGSDGGIGSSSSLLKQTGSRSCSQLDQAEQGRVTRLTGALFTKVSDGESEPLPVEGWELVRSWSFPGKVNTIPGVDTTLEESTPAEEYFSSSSRDSSSVVIDDIITDLLDRVAILSGDLEVSKEDSGPRVRQLQYQSTITSASSGNVEHLHSHILLYTQPYDGEHVLYTLHTLRNILVANSSAFLCAASTTSLVSRSSILALLGSHKKSLFGRGWGGETVPLKNSMYLEVLIITCLYYLRSYYPPGLSSVTTNHLNTNAQVQVLSCELLGGLVQEMIGLVRSSGTGLACYLSDLFSRLKVHKIVLHTAITVLSKHRTHRHSNSGSPVADFTSAVLDYNDCGHKISQHSLSHYAEAFQIQLARLLLSLIILEYEVKTKKNENNLAEKPTEGSDLKYINGKLIPQQPLFIACLTRALECDPEMRPTQVHWTSLVTSCLEYLGPATTWVATTIIRQLCRNIESLSVCYSSSPPNSFPADYGVNQLEALTVLCHYCLLDTNAPFNQPPSPSVQVSASSQILTSIAHLFIASSPSNKSESKDKVDWQVNARKAVLGFLPRIIASVAVLWQALVNRKDKEGENCVVGSPRVVKQQLLDLLSPIAKHHSTSFLAAMAVVWRERRVPTTPQSLVAPSANEDQIILVQLLIGIKALPMDALVQTIHQVVKQPAGSEEIGVEVSALELFVQYMSQTGSPVADSWPKFYTLLRDQHLFSPPAQFLLLGLLDHFVHQKCPPLQDRKDLKDLQDITAKMVEGLTTIAGACLEQTTWLRRNLAVREEEPLIITPDKEEKHVDTDGEPLDNETSLQDESLSSLANASTVTAMVSSGPPLADSIGKKKVRKSKLQKVKKKIMQDAQIHMWFVRVFVNEQLPYDSEFRKTGGGSVAGYSTAALIAMAQLLAPLLDVVFGSQEKERVITLVTNLMYNVTPYLKNHTIWNGNSYYASSQLMASLSSFQYTRKAWKKDTMELLLDSAFFQMEPRSVPYWRTIIDNLVSQDTTTFRELIGRVSMAQGNGLNLFTSKEQEYEQKAQLLKRLAFVILCSEKDQFHKHMPDIQERLAEVVRLPVVVPVVQAAVMLCFRVLLLRMSPQHVVPLWPIIVSEMVQVLLHMEVTLSTDSEEFSLQVGASMEWGLPNGVGMNSQQWLLLQLATAHLLFLCVQLPPDLLPQFALYRWAFVGADGRSGQTSADYVPHVTKISRLMDARFGVVEALPVPLLPSGSNIRALSDLHPFFSAMSSGRYTQLSLSQIEHNLELDFLDPMSSK